MFKKRLSKILEEADEDPLEAASGRRQLDQEAAVLREAASEAVAAAAPALKAEGPGPAERGGAGWRDCLVRALVEMPPEVAERVMSALPREVLIEVLKGRDDPYLKLALMLLK